MRWPISLKLSLSYLGVICIAGLPALLLLDIDLGRSLRERRDRELVSRARLIADLIPTRSPAVSSPDSGATALAAAIRVQDALADRLARDAGARITLIDPDGRVLGDSALDPTAIARLDSHPTARK